MSRRIVERLNAMPEQDRFLRGMIAWLGGKQVELLYDRDARHAGATGYTLAKMLRLAVDGLTSFSTAPLRLAGLLSLLGVCVAFALAIYAVVGFCLGQGDAGLDQPGPDHRLLLHRPADLHDDFRRVPGPGLHAGQAPAALSGR